MDNHLKHRKPNFFKYRSLSDGFKNNRNNIEAFLRKKINMLKRRVSSLTNANMHLKETNLELITKLNNTKLNLATVTQEKHGLITSNFNLMMDCNKKNEENIKLMRILRLLSAEFKISMVNIGNLSEGLINMSNLLESNLSNPLGGKGSANTMAVENITPDSQKVQKSLSVNPMVGGHVIYKPTVMLQRMQVTCNRSVSTTNENPPTDLLNSSPVEVGLETEQDLQERRDDEFNLSTIQEESPSEFRRSAIKAKGRLGLRQRHSYSLSSTSESSTIRSGVRAQHSSLVTKVPVVRLQDVSRMLNNSSWCTVPRTDLDDGSSSEREESDIEHKIILQESSVNQAKKERKRTDPTIIENSPDSEFQPPVVHSCQQQSTEPGPSWASNEVLLTNNINLRRHDRSPIRIDNSLFINKTSPDQPSSSSMENGTHTNDLEKKGCVRFSVSTPANTPPQMSSTPAAQFVNDSASQLEISAIPSSVAGDIVDGTIKEMESPEIANPCQNSGMNSSAPSISHLFNGIGASLKESYSSNVVTRSMSKHSISQLQKSVRNSSLFRESLINSSLTNQAPVTATGHVPRQSAIQKTTRSSSHSEISINSSSAPSQGASTAKDKSGRATGGKGKLRVNSKRKEKMVRVSEKINSITDNGEHSERRSAREKKVINYKEKVLNRKVRRSQ